MEKKRSVQLASLLILSVMLSQNLVLYAANFEEQKSFFNFPPSVYTPPAVYSPPSQGSVSGSYPCPTPSKGGSYTPTPSKGGSYTPSPSKGGSYGKPPSKGSSSSPVYQSPPVSTPTPVYQTPPSSSPQTPPYSCIYWKTHPGLIFAVFGWWGTVCSAFNTPSIPGFSPSTSLLQALSNTRTDGYGDLYREGTAALLNSMAHSASYPYSTAQVRDGFMAALSSNDAAAVQAKLYKMANEARVN